MIKTWKEGVAPDINGQYLVGVKDAMQSEIDELRAALATARAEKRERCAKIAASRESYSMPIPCPDNRPGCCVAHSVPATRDRRGTEIAAAIRALTDE